MEKEHRWKGKPFERKKKLEIMRRVLSEKSGRWSRKEEGPTMVKRWRGGGRVKFLRPPGPGLVWAPMHNACFENAASKMLDNSVNRGVFFTIKTVLGCRDIGLKFLLLNAKFTIPLATNREAFASKKRRAK